MLDHMKIVTGIRDKNKCKDAKHFLVYNGAITFTSQSLRLRVLAFNLT